MDHRPRRRHKIGLANMMTFFFPCDYPTNELNQFFIRGTTTHQFVQIMIPNRKKTSTNLPVGSYADAAAVSAKRMRNRRDDPDLSNAVIETIEPCSFAALMRNFYQWPVLRHAMQDFIQSYDRLRCPNPIFFERHKLNEAHY